MKSSFFIMVLLMLTNTAFAQERDWEVASGLGLPDGIHIGINRDIAKRSNIGVNFGSFSSELSSVLLTLEHKLNFRYSRKFASLPSWYFGQRLTYYYEDNGENIWSTLYLTPALSKHFNITSRLGFNVDIGASIRLWQNIKRKSANSKYEDGSNLRFLVLPSARVQFFYKF